MAIGIVGDAGVRLISQFLPLMVSLLIVTGAFLMLHLTQELFEFST
uniref:V-type proton ATPase proteolipid subunit n=1 Tax=Rhizophora mucronata TaxID=61149 RepID=A0A2P2K0I2_RHIMU